MVWRVAGRRAGFEGRGDSRSRGLLALGVALTAVLAGTGFALGRDAAAGKVAAHPGEAWLSTRDDGTVNLVDGISGGSAAKVRVPGAAGHDVAVTQQGSLVFVRDTVTGAITVVDTSQLVAGVQVPHSTSTDVLTGGGVTYLVDRQTGAVQEVEAATLAPIGAQIHLHGALGTAIVDRSGTLWVPVADGTVVPVTASTAGSPIRVAAGGADMVMALAGGTPVAVDRTAGALTAVTPQGAGQVVKLPGAAASGESLQVASVDGNQPLPLLETGSVSQLVLVDVATRVPTSIGLPSGYRGDSLGSPLQEGQRTYIPDYTQGGVLVFDGAQRSFAPSLIPVLAGSGHFEADLVDGIVYFNDPASGNAVSVTGDGKTHQISKNGQVVPASGTAAAPPASQSSVPPSQSSQPPKSQPSSAPKPSDTAPSSAGHNTPVPAPSPSAPGAPTSVPVPVAPSGTTPLATAPAPKPSSAATSPAPPPTTGPTPNPATSTSTPAPKPTPTTPGPTPKPTTPSPTPIGNPPAVGQPILRPGNGSVVVSWTNPANAGAVKSYSVTVSPNAGTQAASGATSVTVSGLACGQVYTFAVVSHGPTGLTSTSPTASSLACTAPGAPTAVGGTGVGADGVQVHWAAPANHGVGALSYVVTLNGATQTVSTTSATFTGLTPGRPYTATVRAQTAGGTSPIASAGVTAGAARAFTVNLSNISSYYVWMHMPCANNISTCVTWIQSGPNTWNDAHQGSVVTTVRNGGSVTAYCYKTGYNSQNNNLVHDNAWLYVSANGHWGYASAEWFGANSVNQNYGMPLCPGSPPTG